LLGTGGGKRSKINSKSKLFLLLQNYYYTGKVCVLKQTTGEKQDLPFCPFEKFSYLSHKNVTLGTAAFYGK